MDRLAKLNIIYLPAAGIGPWAAKSKIASPKKATHEKGSWMAQVNQQTVRTDG